VTWETWTSSEKSAGGTIERLLADGELVEIVECSCRVVSLPSLTGLKRASGRGKDREALAELEALLEERDREE
jgi:hypothetical protein